MRLRRVLLGVLAGGLCLPPAAWARCNQVTTISDASGGSVTYSDLADAAARVCSVEFFANAANGVAVLYDSPDDTDGHAQTQIVSEPGAASAGDSASAYYGEEGRPTRFGLDAVVTNGTLIVQWSGTAP